MEFKAKEGFVYVVTGIKHVNEARESAQYLKISNPNYPICLISDIEDKDPVWNDFVKFENPEHTYCDKIKMYLCPYQKALFLDSDTYIAMDISQLFMFLDRFEMIVHQMFEGHDYQMEGIPDAFHEFNTGVIGFQNTDRFKQFCDKWYSLYDKKFWPNDQRSFREAMYYSDMRYSNVTSEFNFRPMNTNFASLPVYILHGRTFEKMKELSVQLNSTFINRAYIPSLDCVVYDYMKYGEITKLMKNSFVLFVRETLKFLVPINLRTRLRSISGIRRIFLKNKALEYMN